MRLKIDNFAKINKADIVVDGITVIAGENNTGKSTVGKILFSLFNSISDIDAKIVEQRTKEIRDTLSRGFRNFYRLNFRARAGIAPSHLSGLIAEEISDAMNDGKSLEISDICNIIKKRAGNVFSGKELEDETLQAVIKEAAEKITAIMTLSNHSITLEVLTRYFNHVFYNQINSLYDKGLEAHLNLNIKGKAIDLKFVNNECISCLPEIDIMHQAIYIDNPFIIDKLSVGTELNAMDEFLQALLINDPKDNIMDGIIESVLAKEKLDEVYQALSAIVDAKIVEKSKNEFFLEKEGFIQPISFNNLSTGLKSFVILKMLIERGALKERDVLILDEPEIHLHPQWQVAYAELIVLLQKKFDLSIVITTHSPYFLDAVNLFSVKYGIGEKVNYYLAETGEQGIQMEQVSGNIAMIYDKMASPIHLLDTLRYELNNN